MTVRQDAHDIVDGPDDVSITPLPKIWVQEAIENTTARKRQVHTEAKLLVSLGYWVLPVKKLGKGYPEKQFNANSATNNPKKIDEWFHPETGRFAGWNLAIACGFKEGSAVIVADADRHGRADGVKEWNDLVNAHGTPDKHPWAKTPNDGEHHFFKWHAAFTKKSTKPHKDSGLEVLGGKHGSFTSFVLVYPSVVKDRKGNHKQYEWQVHPKDCQPPPTPDWLPFAFSVAEQQSRGEGKGNENVIDSDLEPTIPIQQIERMLASINPDKLTYDEWLHIGMAIHSQNPDGVDTWNSWSRRGKRYEIGECEKRWRGFSKTGKKVAVSIGTLFYHARQHGWKPQKDDKYCDPVSLAVAKLNQTYAYVVVGGHDRILRLRPDNEIGELHYDLIAPIAFSRMFPGQIVQHPNWEKAKPLPKAWIESPYRRSYLFGLRLSPHEETPPGVLTHGMALHTNRSRETAHYFSRIYAMSFVVATWNHIHG